MKKILAIIVLLAASNSFARAREGVRCQLNDKTFDQVKLSVYFDEEYHCDDSAGPAELSCQQNPDTESMDSETLNQLTDNMIITKCISREPKEVNIKTQSGRIVKTVHQLKVSDSQECQGVQMPKVAGELACYNNVESLTLMQGAMGNPRIRDTEL